MPQRFLRPGITNSDRWNAVSFGAQSFFVRILTLVDDFGRYDGRIAILHGQCFALRPEITCKHSAAFRSELHAAHLIQVYEHEGKEFIQVEKWTERSRSDKSKFPDPPERNNAAQDSAAVGSEAQGKDASLATTSSPLHPRPSSLAIASTQLRWSEATGWVGVTDAMRAEWKEAYPTCNVDRQLAAMTQWLKANPAKAKKTAWLRFVSNWLNREQNRGGDLRFQRNGGSRGLDKSSGAALKPAERAKIPISYHGPGDGEE